MSKEMITPIIAIIILYGLIALVVLLAYKVENKGKEEKIGFFKWMKTNKGK